MGRRDGGSGGRFFSRQLRGPIIAAALFLVLPAAVALAGQPSTVTDRHLAAERCKGDGWRQLRDRDGGGFANQGRCVSYVRGGGSFGGEDEVALLAPTDFTMEVIECGLYGRPGTCIFQGFARDTNTAETNYVTEVYLDGVLQFSSFPWYASSPVGDLFQVFGPVNGNAGEAELHEGQTTCFQVVARRDLQFSAPSERRCFTMQDIPVPAAARLAFESGPPGLDDPVSGRCDAPGSTQAEVVATDLHTGTVGPLNGDGSFTGAAGIHSDLPVGVSVPVTVECLDATGAVTQTLSAGAYTVSLPGVAVQLSPTVGPPGTTVTISGTCPAWQAWDRVQLWMTGTSGPAVAVATDGSFTGDVTVVATGDPYEYASAGCYTTDGYLVMSPVVAFDLE